MVSLRAAIKWKAPESPIHKGKRDEVSGGRSKRWEPVDYREYRFTLKEEIRCDLEGLLGAAVFSYFFYRSIWAFIIMLPLVGFYRKEKKRKLAAKRMERLEKEFRETLLSVNINLQAGYSMENAFMESYRDVLNLFGKASYMTEELIIIRKGMGNGIPLARLLMDLGNRCPGGEIQEFAEVFSIAGRTGGKWQEIMKKTVDIIQEKAEIKEEIGTIIHAKRVESRIMCLVPFVILLYMNLTSPGYFDVLYHNIAGICIMTVCLLIYAIAFYWTGKITEIAV